MKDQIYIRCSDELMDRVRTEADIRELTIQEMLICALEWALARPEEFDRFIEQRKRRAA